MDIIIYAIIAAVLAYRLYTILGQRDDGERRQRPNPFAMKIQQDKERDAARARPPERKQDDEDILAFPLNPAQREEHSNPLSVTAALPAPESLAGGLYAIRMADPGFDEKQFVKGARMAFEMIVHAFAASERDALRNLMVPRLYDAFAGAIDAREKAGQKMEMKILMVREAEIIAARLDKDGYAVISVQYVSDQKKEIRDANNQLVENGGLEQLTDVWTFKRRVPSSDPNWQLVETRSV